MLKRTAVFVVILSMILPQTVTAFAAGQEHLPAEEKLTIQKLAINPDYQDYPGDSEAFKTGGMSQKYLFPIARLLSGDTGENLPVNFDARSNGWIPPVRDQKRTGTCWAHAIMASVETALKKKGDLTSAEGGFYNFSEGHLAYNTGDKDIDLNTGGYLIYGGTYFSKLNGPVTEEEFPQYSIDNAKGETGYTKFEGIEYDERLDKKDGSKYVGDMIVVSKKEIKKFVYNYGLVTAVYKDTAWNSEYWQDGYKGTLTRDKNGYHNPDDEGYVHAVTIVGWDDNKKITNRKGQTSAGGAFLVRNSWGTRVGDYGYFWMSYETFGDDDTNYYVFTNVSEKRDNVYQFNVMDFETVSGMSVYDSKSKPQFIANRYMRDPDKKENISDIALYNMNVGPTDFEIWITEDKNWQTKVNLDSGDIETRLDKIAEKVAKFKLNNPGYFSRELNILERKEYPLTSDSFVIIAKITPSAGEEARFASTDSRKGSEGESYILLGNTLSNGEFTSMKVWQNKDTRLSLNAVTKYASTVNPPGVTVPDTAALRDKFERLSERLAAEVTSPLESLKINVKRLDLIDIGGEKEISRLEDLKKKYADMKIGDNAGMKIAAAEINGLLDKTSSENEENIKVFAENGLNDKKTEAEELASLMNDLKLSINKLQQDMNILNFDINAKVIKLQEKIEKIKSTPVTPPPASGGGGALPSGGNSGGASAGGTNPGSGSSNGVSFGGADASDKIKTVASEVFVDVRANSWYENAVGYVFNNGIMMGTSDKYFNPAMDLSRAMMVQLLYNISGKPKKDTASPFSDVSEKAWYKDAVVWAKSNDLAKGISSHEFGPDNGITREQMVTMIYNYAYMLRNIKLDGNYRLDAFKDSHAVSEYALIPMKWAVNSGIISGDGEGYLNPKAGATRAQIAKVMENFIKKSNGN